MNLHLREVRPRGGRASLRLELNHSPFGLRVSQPQFQPVIEWLMLHRDGLDVLIHPLTDDSVDDHSIYAMWLGSPVPLELNTLQVSWAVSRNGRRIPQDENSGRGP